MKRFEHQDFRQHPHRRPSADAANCLCGPVSSHGPDDTLIGGTSGGSMLHLANSYAGLCAAVTTVITST